MLRILSPKTKVCCMSLKEWYLRLTSDLHTQNRYSWHESSNKHVEWERIEPNSWPWPSTQMDLFNISHPGRHIIFRTLSVLESPSVCWGKLTSCWPTILCQSYQNQPLPSSLCGCQIHWGREIQPFTLAAMVLHREHAEGKVLGRLRASQVGWWKL